MADPIISVGTTLGMVASSPATYDSAGFAALTFVTVGEITNMGDVGGTAQIVENTTLQSGIIGKYKGSINYGSAPITIGKDATDAGQVLLKAAFDGADRDTEHSFAITDSNGDITYFSGLVSSYVKSTGDANTVRMLNTTIELNNELIEA